MPSLIVKTKSIQYNHIITGSHLLEAWFHIVQEQVQAHLTNETWPNNMVPSIPHGCYKRVNKQLMLYPATMTHIRFIHSSSQDNFVCLGGLMRQGKDIFRKGRRQRRKQYTEYETGHQSKGVNLGSNRTCNFLSKMSKKLVCMPGISLNINYELCRSLQ